MFKLLKDAVRSGVTPKHKFSHTDIVVLQCMYMFMTSKANDVLKQLSSSCSKKLKMNKITVNTGPVMFSGEIYYTEPLIQLTKSLVKHSFSLHNLLRYLRSSRYMYSRSIPWQKSMKCLFLKQKRENM